MKPASQPAPALRAILRSWFHLTPNERLALSIILLLILLGLGARAWHLSREQPEPYQPPPGLRQ